MMGRGRSDLFEGGEFFDLVQKKSGESDRDRAAREAREEDAMDANEERDQLGPGVEVVLDAFCRPTAIEQLRITGRLPARPFVSRAITTVTAVANGATETHVAPVEIFSLLERSERTRHGLTGPKLTHGDLVEVLFELERIGFPLAPEQTRRLLERRSARWLDNAKRLGR